MSSDACSPQSRLKEAVETSKEAGGASLRKPDEFKAVCEAVAGIALDDDDAALETAKEVAIKIKELCKDASLMTEMMNQLHESSVASETLGCQTAVVFGCLSQLEVEGVKCRNVFLRRIQQDFASKTKAQDEDDDADINLQDHFRYDHFVPSYCITISYMEYIEICISLENKGRLSGLSKAQWILQLELKVLVSVPSMILLS